MKVAIVKGGRVRNVIVSDTIPKNGVDVTGKKVGPGWTINGETGAFEPPNRRRGDTKPRNVVSKLEFLDRFTLKELVAIETACEDNPTLRVAVKYLDSTTEVDLDGDRAEVYMDLLNEYKIMKPARIAEILGQ